MTGARLAERLAWRGLESSGVDAARPTIGIALRGLRRITSGWPRFAWWVPGRLEVFGKHTDYAGGRSLVAALPRGFIFMAAPRAGGDIRVLDAATGEQAVFGGDPGELDGWRRYAGVVVSRLARNFPGARRGADIAFASNLPRAAGMSSSSALVVGLAAALARLWSLDERPEWRGHIPDAESLAAYYASIENGCTFGDLAGDGGVGTRGGSEDHAAMLLAAPRRVSAFAFVPLRRAGGARMPDAWRFVVAASGVAAEKTGRAREAYNRASAAASVLLRVWNTQATPATSLGDALASAEGAAGRLRRAIRVGEIPGWTAGDLERRLDHFLREDARVPDALAAFDREDAARLGPIAAASQRDAEALLGNQIAETAALAKSAVAWGAFAASSFGAGFGGSVWALVEAELAEEFAKNWVRAVRPAAPGVEAFIATPGPPLAELAGGGDMAR